VENVSFSMIACHSLQTAAYGASESLVARKDKIRERISGGRNTRPGIFDAVRIL
jgi:hypothetical protein